MPPARQFLHGDAERMLPRMPLRDYAYAAQFPATSRLVHMRLLERTALNVAQVSEAAGFGSAAVMREHFGTVVGTSPLLYRRAFQR
jgi:transcriptional regulator GlxA family with amidase domain